MPVRSAAQRRFIFAVAEGKVADVSPSVGKEFIAKSHGLKHLPERVRKKVGRRLMRRGRS